MITQVQKLWMLDYIPTQYSSILFRLLHYYKPDLITVTRNWDVVPVNIFFTSTTVVLNHFAEESQIQTYNFVKEPL